MADLLGLMSTFSSLLCCMCPVAKPHASVGERRRVHTPPALHTTLRDPKERVIIVGDVHGCLDELNGLLDACEYTEERDTVILVGDLARLACDMLPPPQPAPPARGLLRTRRGAARPLGAKAVGTPSQCAHLGRGSAPEAESVGASPSPSPYR